MSRDRRYPAYGISLGKGQLMMETVRSTRWQCLEDFMLNETGMAGYRGMLADFRRKFPKHRIRKIHVVYIV